MKMKFVFFLLLLIPLVSTAQDKESTGTAPLFAIRTSTINSISGLVTGM